jgi:hypothetical protein
MQRILVAATIVLIYVGICRFVAVPEGFAKLVQDTRQFANEAGAINLVKTIGTCQLLYQVTKGKGKYADLKTLCEENDDILGSLASKESPRQKYGYRFASIPVDSPGAPPMFDTRCLQYPYPAGRPSSTVTARLGLSAKRAVGAGDDHQSAILYQVAKALRTAQLPAVLSWPEIHWRASLLIPQDLSRQSSLPAILATEKTSSCIPRRSMFSSLSSVCAS